jgi:hypothetical protein
MADWAEKVEIAMSLDDEEANQIRRNAAATGDPEKIAAANAYIANLWSLAQQNGCKTISGCNGHNIDQLRNIWKDTQSMTPTGQLNLQNRIGLNIYQLGRYFPQDLTPMLNELAQNARKNRGRSITVDQLWGNAGGVTFFTNQWNAEMKGVQRSILRGGMTAKQWRDIANLDKGLDAILQGFAKFILAGMSDEDWGKIRNILLSVSVGILAGIVLAYGVVAVIAAWEILGVWGLQSAAATIFQQGAFGAFLNVSAHMASNEIRIQCGENLSIYDGVGSQAFAGAIVGMSSGAAMNFATMVQGKIAQVLAQNPDLARTVLGLVKGAEAYGKNAPKLTFATNVAQNIGSIAKACGEQK